MWNDLKSMSAIVNMLWGVLGDFNEICFAHEKWGGNPPKEYKMRIYRETMLACDLVDLSFSGHKFTWFNKRKAHPIFKRLDRVWATTNWLLQFPNALVVTP